MLRSSTWPSSPGRSVYPMITASKSITGLTFVGAVVLCVDNDSFVAVSGDELGEQCADFVRSRSP